MHRDLQSINAGAKVIAAAAININGHIIGFRAEAAADISLADAIEADEMPPAFHVGVHQQRRVAVVCLPAQNARRQSPAWFRCPAAPAGCRASQNQSDDTRPRRNSLRRGRGGCRTAGSIRVRTIWRIWLRFFWPVEYLRSLSRVKDFDRRRRLGRILRLIDDLPARQTEFVKRPLRYQVANHFKNRQRPLPRHEISR